MAELDENLDEMLENQEPFREGDVPGGVPFLSSVEEDLTRPGRTGMALGEEGVGVAGDGASVASPLLGIWAAGVDVGSDVWRTVSREVCDQER